jgi:hypothetical protein
MSYFLMLDLNKHAATQNWAGMAETLADWWRAFGALPEEAKTIAREAGDNLIPLKKEGMIFYKLRDGEYGRVMV